MRVMLERSTLAHEVGHAVLGHPDDSARHELAADRFAARKLIHPDDLRAAAQQSPDPAMWAVELQVTPRILETYLRDHRAA